MEAECIVFVEGNEMKVKWRLSLQLKGEGRSEYNRIRVSNKMGLDLVDFGPN